MCAHVMELWFPLQTLMPNSTGFKYPQGLEGRQLSMARERLHLSTLQ